MRTRQLEMTGKLTGLDLNEMPDPRYDSGRRLATEATYEYLPQALEQLRLCHRRTATLCFATEK